MIRQIKRASNETDWKKPLGMGNLLYRVLLARGIHSDAEAYSFLHPNLGDLHDPFLLNDMQKAVNIIREAVDQHRKMIIYGDYDADGVCASTILVRHLRSLGADVDVYLPDRYTEGYGLNETAIRKIAEDGGRVLVTVDCGITSQREIALAKELGIICVVTDHHTPSDLLPDCPVVNPLLNKYPFPYLCGAGVAFKTVAALSGMQAAMQYIEFAALATIADIVSLTGENRIIAFHGLNAINRTRYAGIEALCRVSRYENASIDSQKIGFGLAPRLNACGRMETAYDAFHLLMTDDPVEAEKYAEIAESRNVLRKNETNRVYLSIEKQMDSFSFAKHRAIVLPADDCPGGIAGLVAGKLTEIYHMPAIVLSENGDNYVGSCRSIEGVNIHDALKSCEEYLVRYGGHSQAAGLTIKKENLPAFIDALDEYLTREIAPEIYIPYIEYDTEMDIEDLTVSEIATLAALEPTGRDNPEPYVLIQANPMYPRIVGSDQSHLKLTAVSDTASLALMWFNHAEQRDRLPDAAEIVVQPLINEYMGRTSPEGYVKSIHASEQNIPYEPCLLTDILYNYKGLFQTVAAEDARNMLSASVYGTLVVCQTSKVLETAVKIFAGLPADIALHGENPYPFNAIALRPDMDTVRKYENVLVLGSENGLTGNLFDKDGLREILKKLKQLLSNGERPFAECAAAAAEAAGCGVCAAGTAVKALCELKLLTANNDRISLSQNAPRRVDPETNVLFRAISYMSNFHKSAEEENACRIRAMYVQA